MAILQGFGGQIVQIGDISKAAPRKTTWGDSIIPSNDAGVPLFSYRGGTPTDPLTIWATQPAVRKVVSFAARNIAAVSLRAYRRKSDADRERVSGSYAEAMFRRPMQDRTMTRDRLLRDLMIDRMLYDRYCLLLDTERGELIRIPPHLLDIHSDPLGRVTFVGIWAPNGQLIDITDQPKAMDWGWFGGAAGGLSPMQTLAEILAEQREAVEWRRARWREAPKISGVLTRPETSRAWNPKERERFINSWREWKSTNKMGGTPILEDGMKYEDLSGNQNTDKFQDLEGRKLTDAEVATAFHIPPELIGVRETTYGNIEAFLKMLYGPVLGPEIRALGAALNTGLVPFMGDNDPDIYLEFDIEGAKTASSADRARAIQTAVGGPFMTRAEARADMNLPFLEGTDELITPLNVTTGGQASPTDSGTQNEDLSNEERAAQ